MNIPPETYFPGCYGLATILSDEIDVGVQPINGEKTITGEEWKAMQGGVGEICRKVEAMDGGALTLDAASEVATAFELGQNYPNPFNPVTTIRFRLPEAENVRVQVFTLQGREIARLLDEWRTAGMHSLNFEAGPSLPNGVYLVTVKAGAHRSMKRVTVLR